MGSNPTSGTNVWSEMLNAMRRTLRACRWIALLSVLAAPAFAGCPEGMREFRGAISQLSAQKLFVDSRLDDNIGFERAPETKISDEAGQKAYFNGGEQTAKFFRKMQGG